MVIASSNKAVEVLEPPIPLELLAFGLDATLAELGRTELRDTGPSPDGGVIADYRGTVEDAAALSAHFDAWPGVIAHGLFPPEMTADVLIARGDEVEHRVLARPSS